jgi:hypothetical protein
VDSNATSRGTAGGDGGAMDTTGTDWVADGIWNQHTESGFWASGTGGTVKNSRVTSEWADGINLNNVSLTGTVGANLTATNNFVRGTGDDAMAINSVAYNGSTTYTAMSNVTLSNNTLIAPWGGKGIGIYGGGGHHVQNNYISDTARYIGLGAGRFGVNGSDLHGATVSGNEVVRSGGDAYNQGQPAFHIGNGGDGQNTGVVDSVNATGNTIVDSLYDGAGFSQSTNSTFADNTITSPWRNGIVIQPPFYPAPSGSASITGNTVSGLGGGFQPYINNSSGFTASVSGNSWQSGGGGGTPEGPYSGTAAAVPGTVQAENYDTGGEGVGYHVTSANGSGNTYRSDGVDLEATSDTGGGSDLGWTSAGQWFRYTVNVATAGTYTVSLRVAAPSAVTGALHLSDASGTNLTGAVSLPQTGGWQTWATVTANVTLPAGPQVLTLNQDTGGWNLNYLALAPGGSGGNPNPDLALNKATTASGSNQTYGPANAVDGNTSTYWESTNNAFPQWIQVDLGSGQSVGRIVMDLPPATAWSARTQTVLIQGSTDGTAYSTLAPSVDYAFDPATGNTASATFTAANVRYVKLTFTANTGWPAGQLSELQLFGS